MQNTKKRNLILTLLVGLLMSVLAFVGISLAPKTAFADTLETQEQGTVKELVQGDTLTGKKLYVVSNAVIQFNNYEVTFNPNIDFLEEVYSVNILFTEIDDMGLIGDEVGSIEIPGTVFEDGLVFTLEDELNVGSITISLEGLEITSIVSGTLSYIEEDPGTTPEDPEDPGTTPEDPGTTPEDPETPGDDVTLLPDVSEETTKWGEVTETVANWFSENTGLKITGSFVSIALVVIVLSFIFKKK